MSAPSTGVAGTEQTKGHHLHNCKGSGFRSTRQTCPAEERAKSQGSAIAIAPPPHRLWPGGETATCHFRTEGSEEFTVNEPGDENVTRHKICACRSYCS